MAPNRRRFLLLAAAAGFAACGGGDDDPPSEEVSEEETESDVAVLNNLLDLEHMSVAAYGSAGGSLRGPVGQLGRHERAHAGDLARVVRILGGTPNVARPRAEYSADFPPLGGRDAALEFLLDVESTSVAAYLDALPKVNSPRLRNTVAAALTTEAEHLAIVLGELGRAQAPKPFVTGDL